MTEAEKTHSYKKETALTKPRVVIVGGGFGGLYAARALAGAPVSVTLIDKRNYHLFRPLLYQAATGLLSADEISGPLRSILSRQNNIDILLGEVTGVDTQKRFVRLEQHDVPYDFLILATGVQYNYFGHDEWSRIAPGLVSLSDADRIRAKVLLAFEQRSEEHTSELQSQSNLVCRLLLEKKKNKTTNRRERTRLKIFPITCIKITAATELLGTLNVHDRKTVNSKCQSMTTHVRSMLN